MLLAACSQPAPTTTVTATAKPAAPTTITATATATATVTATAKPTTTAAPSPTAAPGAQTAAEFYAKNPLVIVVTSSPGGSSDYIGRLVSAYWSIYSGGLSKVENRPGGGNVIGVNYVYAAKPDGATLFCGENLESMQLLGDAGVQYDVNKMEFVIGLAQTPSNLVVSVKSPFVKADDLKGAKNVTWGVTSVLSEEGPGAALLNDIYGWQGLRVVSGYGGAAEAGLALGKGEVQMGMFGAASAIDFMDKGFVKKPPLLTFDRVKSPAFPDVPAITDIGTLTPIQENYLKLCIAFQSLKKFATGPGVPADRLAFLREAFMKIAKDTAFVGQAKLRFPIWSNPIAGADMNTRARNTMAMPKADIETAIANIKKLADIK